MSYRMAGAAAAGGDEALLAAWRGRRGRGSVIGLRGRVAGGVREDRLAAIRAAVAVMEAQQRARTTRGRSRTKTGTEGR